MAASDLAAFAWRRRPRIDGAFPMHNWRVLAFALITILLLPRRMRPVAGIIAAFFLLRDKPPDPAATPEISIDMNRSQFRQLVESFDEHSVRGQLGGVRLEQLSDGYLRAVFIDADGAPFGEQRLWPAAHDPGVPYSGGIVAVAERPDGCQHPGGAGSNRVRTAIMPATRRARRTLRGAPTA